MGGTLPAAVRASEIETDRARHILAIVYGANTFGAVLGVVFSTFYLLEHLGNHATLWIACALNVLIALVAFGISRFMPVNRSASGEVDKAAPEEIATQTPLGVVCSEQPRQSGSFSCSWNWSGIACSLHCSAVRLLPLALSLPSRS
jgi:hypothetical protein